jgi:osmotically-inducible protein OsmY
MGTNIMLLGIALVGLCTPLFAEADGETLASETMIEFMGSDSPYQNNSSKRAELACQEVSPRGPLGGTRDWEWKSDAELKKAVECELMKSPFLKTSGIQVAVLDGRVTLSGTVYDQDSLRSAVVDAYHAGVKEVISELEVMEDEKK